MNLKTLGSLLLLCFLTLSNMAQNKPAYRLFNAKGKKISYKKALKKLSGADLIFFGESHNNPIAHWLELEILKDLHQKGEQTNIKAGAEMFERHQQETLEAYLKGKIEEDSFQNDIKLWGNYNTDYRPIVEYCKEHNLPFFATNIPREFARKAFKEGIEALNELKNEEKALLPPLPIEIDYHLPSYQNMKNLMGGHGMTDDKLKRFIEAQAAKDATMAHFTLENYEPGATIIHYNGSYHSDDKEGIIWYVKQKQPDLEVINITTVDQDSVKKLDAEYIGKADIILVTPTSMTKTYVFGMK